ncbi:dynamin family protein [Lujinxingia litoralis]|nr:dynamin family protein [Lujinxingia litoralis]
MSTQAESQEPVTINRGHVTGFLEDLAEMARTSGLRSLADEVVEERIPALERGQVSLVVLGEFNHGKSTVVNALLGQEVLPMGITPTTAVITHLVHATEPRAAFKERRGGALHEVAYERLGELIRHAEEQEEEPEYVEIGYPNDFLEEGLILVDTPGVNDISRQKVEITYGYLPRADVILYVLDATQVLKKSEVVFIRDRLLKANRDRIIFVLGKIDALSEEEAREVEAYARQRLETLIGPVELFAFSARQALEAQKKGEEPGGDFAAFRGHVREFVRERKEAIVLDSALGGALRIAAMMEQNLAIKRQGYRLEQAELEERIKAVHARLRESQRVISENVERVDERAGGIAATARHNLRVFSQGFAEALPVQVERAEAKDVKRYLSRWIQDTFQGWLEGEGQEIARGLEELAEEVIEVTNQSMREVVGALREELGLGPGLDLEIDTLGYDVSVFALGTLGVSVWLFANALVGGLLTLATPILAVILKGRGDERLKDRAKEEGVAAIREATEAIEAELLRMIHNYADKLKAFIEHAGDRLYGQIEEALEQVQRERAEEGDREVLIAQVDERLEAVHRLARMIQLTRERLMV